MRVQCTQRVRCIITCSHTRIGVRAEPGAQHRGEGLRRVAVQPNGVEDGPRLRASQGGRRAKHVHRCARSVSTLLNPKPWPTRAAGLGANVRGFHSAADFVASLQKPRAVIIMVSAGRPVDETIEKLAVHMERGDVLIDGGNSFYEDTERRIRELGAQGILFLGMGATSRCCCSGVACRVPGADGAGP